MCLAVPAQLKTVNGLEAEIQIGGVSRVVSLWFVPEAKAGDYVYVHAGFAISVVDEAEALESLQLLRDLAAAYPEEQLFRFSDDLPHSKMPHLAGESLERAADEVI